jgi:hypothetical protein
MLTRLIRGQVHREATARVDGLIAASERSPAAAAAGTRLDLRAFRAHLEGGTWEPSDFPTSTARALLRLAIPSPPPSSIVAEIVAGCRRESSEAARDALTWLETGQLMVEALHAPSHVAEVGVAGATAPMAVSLIGIAAGVKLADEVANNVAARRAIAARLGL